jgi:3-hydroxyacyl-[acyl-carrier-protein] dehydratase
MKDKFLDGNFYSVTKSEPLTGENNQFSANILLNPDHPVYKGHFPEMPVAPGVALMGMIQEILEGQLHKSLFLSEASDIKFIRLILPGEQTEFTINYSLKFPGEKMIDANINIKSGDQIFIKIRCKFTVVNFPA